MQVEPPSPGRNAGGTTPSANDEPRDVMGARFRSRSNGGLRRQIQSQVSVPCFLQQVEVAGFCGMYAWPVSAAGSSGRFRETCGRLALNTEFLARLSDGRRGAIMHNAVPLAPEMHDAFPLVHDCSSPALSLSFTIFVMHIVMIQVGSIVTL